ncbi:MAG: calcium/sodium antiporter [Actinobacteria bacterium]|nr:calcium/sodium antiporter [Actinomycetota bacterium]
MGAVAAVAAGFVVLVVASGRFVTGAAGLSLRLRVPAVVVGAVVVGFGTSTPELLTSVLAAAEGSHDIAVGSIVGSNLANLTLVLGLVALVAAPTITSRVLRREVPVTIAAMFVLGLALISFTRWAAVALVVAFTIAVALVLRASDVGGDALDDEVHRELDAEARRSWRLLTLETTGGLLGTIVGAQLLVSGAQSFAHRLDIAEGLVGFTLVALGTSLPEAVTGVQAARRGDPDLAVGNVLGSNLFNSLAIAGVAGLISPGAVSAGLVVTAWLSVGVVVGVAMLMVTSRRLVKWEGILLIGVYLASIPIVA